MTSHSKARADDLAQLSAAVAALTETVRLQGERIDVLERHHVADNCGDYLTMTNAEHAEHAAMLERRRAARCEVQG